MNRLLVAAAMLVVARHCGLSLLLRRARQS